MKRRSFFKGIPAAAAGAAAACNKDNKGDAGSSITGPGPVPDLLPNETLVTVRGGSDGEPLADVLVEVDGVPYRTDGDGQLRLEGAAGDEANVSAPGHISPRSVRLVAGAQDIHLWYLGVMSAEYIRSLVYKAWDSNTNYPLLRLRSGTRVPVLPERDLLNDGAIMTALAAAVDEANRAFGATGISYEFIASGAQPQSSNVCWVSVEPDDPNIRNARAVTYRSRDSSGWITTTRVVFAAVEFARQMAVGAHELGHVAGLWHSQDSLDLMHGSAPGKRFRESEMEVLAAMHRRNAGNTWVDADPGVGVAEASPRLPAKSVVVC